MINVIDKIFSTQVMDKALEQFGSISLKSFLILSLIGIISIILIVSIKKSLHKDIRLSNAMAGIVLVVYLSIVIQLTLMCRESGSRVGIDLNLFNGLIGKESFYHWLMWAYLILNCLMFVPFGFVVSMFSFVNEKSIPVQIVTVTLISFIFSMIIELTQLVTQRGFFELQDLACNTIGGTIGCLIFILIYNLGLLLFEKRKG